MFGYRADEVLRPLDRLLPPRFRSDMSAHRCVSAEQRRRLWASAGNIGPSKSGEEIPIEA
jgi:hypothetical protein